MTVDQVTNAGSSAIRWRTTRRWLALLFADRMAFASACFLLLMILAVIIAPTVLGSQPAGMNLAMRNLPPFSGQGGVAYLLGGDSLGKPILPLLFVAARTTLLIALSVVICATLVGTVLGLVAGYYSGMISNLIMRIADVIMSFPSLLLAMVILFILEPRAANVVIVLTITRLPLMTRVSRAEVLEIRERLFIEGARAAGANDLRILLKHIAPNVAPTMFTVATLDFAGVMLSESALSFLGVGVQPPDVTWGVMVATGRNYLNTAWWLAFWPGLAILLTALSANLLSNWFRVAMDPKLRWRLERRRREEPDA